MKIHNKFSAGFDINEPSFNRPLGNILQKNVIVFKKAVAEKVRVGKDVG